MRLKDIIEAWGAVPGPQTRYKTPEERQADAEADLHDEFRDGLDPNESQKAGQKIGKLLRSRARKSDIPGS